MNNDVTTGHRFLIDQFRVDNETIDRLNHYHSLVIKWQPAQNLVSRETLAHFWVRHICDSSGLIKIAGPKGVWLDYGSGAGFPGLVTAILQKQLSADDASSVVHLVESNKRKVAFLRTVIRETGVNAVVHPLRIEDFIEKSDLNPDFISARAVTALQNLLAYSENFVSKGSVCFFHKGRDINGEIAEAANTFDFDLVKHTQALPNHHQNDGVIAEIRTIRRKTS
ncbi:MAG: 16S rRNA (guanine(527)-N(7))-methyltransferase RsmG [Hyphomicrobiales bacterium]